MVRYTQRDLWTPSDPTGSCMRATWGSIMEVNPDTLPRWTHMPLSVWSYSYRTWFALNGLQVRHARESPPVEESPYDFWLAAGESPRSSAGNAVSHAVVWGERGLVWDPHPSREGLATDDPTFEYLVPCDVEAARVVDKGLFRNGVTNAF